ncbi:hypothetical protein ACHAXH_002751 [Discostella pseudostelligera]
MTSLLSVSTISINRNYCIVGASFSKMAAAAAARRTVTVHHSSPMAMSMSAPKRCFSQYALRINNNSNKNNNPALHWNNFGRSPSCQQRRWNGGNSSSSNKDALPRARGSPSPPSMAESSPNTSTSSSSSSSTFLHRFLAPKPMPPRNTPRWYAEMALICTVFGITGTSTMFLVRPAVSDVLGLKGSFKEGPWSYRICSLVIMTPIYSTLLVIIGTIFGRHAYFRHFSVKMFSRFGVPPELMDKNYHVNAKNFKKW